LGAFIPFLLLFLMKNQVLLSKKERKEEEKDEEEEEEVGKGRELLRCNYNYIYCIKGLAVRVRSGM